METTVVIDLMTEDKKLKAKARTIAVDAATGLRHAKFIGDRENRLEVKAQRIDAVTVVDKIKKEVKLRDAKLISVTPY